MLRGLAELVFSISGFLSDKNYRFFAKKNIKIPGKNSEIEINGYAAQFTFKSYIMTQNVRKIVCTSSELSHWCEASKKNQT